MPDYKQSRCDNCDTTCNAGDEAEIKGHIWERIEAGGIVPSGECPKCGALMYPVAPPSIIEVCIIGGVAEVTSPHVPRGVVLRIRDYDLMGNDGEGVTLDEQGSKCVESRHGSPDDIKALDAVA